MSEIGAGSDPPSPSLSVASSKSSGNTGFDANRIAEVKAWLISQFDAVGKDVPDFEYTPRSIAHLHNIATLSQAKTQAATIVANDFRLKAAEYRSQGGLTYISVCYMPWLACMLLMHMDFHIRNSFFNVKTITSC